MTIVFHTTAEELDESFLASVKAAFKGRAIEIAVTEDDETGYLLRHPANRERLLRAVKNSKTHETALLSEPSLAEDWQRPEEDAAWEHLQQAP